MTIKSTLLFLLIVCFFFKKSVAQKSEISFDLGAGLNGIISEGKSNSNSYNSVLGINIKSFWSPNLYSTFGLQSIFRNQSPFTTYYYDIMYSEVINLQTSFKQVELGLPLFIGTNWKKLSLQIGCTFKYLLKSDLTMTPIGTYNTSQGNINGKYKRTDISTTAMFNDFNYAPAIKIQIPIHKKISLCYQFSYDLEVNPIYYYFANYNTYYNTLFVNIKL